MSDDTSALYWYEPSNVTTSGGNLTAWPDNTGNGMEVSQLSALAVPTWNASGYAEFDGTQALADTTTGTSGRVSGSLSGGGEAVIFAAVQLGTLANGFYPILVEANTTSLSTFTNTSTYFYIDQNAGVTEVVWSSRRFANAFNFSEAISGSDESGTKMLIEVWSTQAEAGVAVDGVSLNTATPTTSGFNNGSSTKIGFGAATDGTSFSTPKFLGDIFEVFVTADASTSNRSAIRSELATKHGITL